jgi:bleomycin hydrolase
MASSDPVAEEKTDSVFELEDSPAVVISDEDLAKYSKEFLADPKNILAMNVVTQSDTLKALRTREAAVRTGMHEYSVKIKDEGKPVTSQQSSGRCWLFAAMNCVRIPFIAEHKLSEFEFSQGFLFFWDKYERCNWFLENIIDTVAEPLDSRLVQHMLATPQMDGGQFDMIVNVVEKYGVCPKDAYPESESQTASRRMNEVVNTKLREFACILRREANEKGADTAALRELKKDQLNTLYRILCIHLGVPPSKFTWKVRNKDDEFIRVDDISPKDFYEKYVRKHFDVSQYFSIVHDPRNDYWKLYTVDRLNNVAGGARSKVLYINVPIETMKELAMADLKDGKPVWFGCHVSKYYWGEDGIMDTKQYDYPLLFGTERVSDDSLMLSTMTKAERLSFGESLMTHAMVFTGVDICPESGKPLKWRVENSWSDKRCHKGYCMMTDDWFNEFQYQIIIDQRRLPTKVTDVLKQTATVLPPWDPMGSLAQ